MGKASNEEAEESEVEGQTPRTSIKGVHPTKSVLFALVTPQLLEQLLLLGASSPTGRRVPRYLHTCTPINAYITAYISSIDYASIIA
jgi:hypothetical protein